MINAIVGFVGKVVANKVVQAVGLGAIAGVAQWGAAALCEKIKATKQPDFKGAMEVIKEQVNNI